MILDYRDFALFNYKSNNDTSKNKFILGEVVINDENEIGVIIQLHGKDEYRSDMFGNCNGDHLRKATKKEISQHRKVLLNETIQSI